MTKISPKALIIGSGGQDGRLLFDELSSLGYSLIGVERKKLRCHKARYAKPARLAKPAEMFDLIKSFRPDEIYYLAAFHASSEQRDKARNQNVIQSYEINILSLGTILEAMRLHSPSSKLFYASSSLIFGYKASGRQTESTRLKPDTLYGITKATGMQLCRLYRENFGLYAVSGILYNHESVYRPENFLSMKIIRGALAIKARKQNEVIVGDLSAKVDWGYAPDYVKAMRLMLALKKPEDLIIATGQLHSVADLAKAAFAQLGLDWRCYVKENKKIALSKRQPLCGDASRLRKKTGWKPTVSFKDMIAKIIDELD